MVHVALDPSVGYGIVLGLGALFAVGEWHKITIGCIGIRLPQSVC